MKRNYLVTSLLCMALLAGLTAGAALAEEGGEVIALLERQVQYGEEIDADEIYEAISGTAKTGPEKTFTSYLADPIPQSISELKGDSLHWLGFKATLTFHSDPDAFEFLAKGYNPIGLSELPQEAKEWFEEDITVIEGVVCYHRNDDFNDYYLFWDESSGRVFFKGRED